MNRLSRRAGFTLMEIMVVIIVIAVLASVAGPMIGSITDQGKSAATKAAMTNLKTALVNYNNDLGRFPHTTSTSSANTINAADTVALDATYDKNVLVNNTVTGTFTNMGINAYSKRWKGPYMDSNPEEFMMDAWDAKIKYYHWNKGIYLHSAGPDGAMDAVTTVAGPNYDGDDILVSVSRVKF
ncbi:MAG: prepilin-type N-terminal cleavage/methylation domain-containing protein [Candidatus Riflebacteria bacterium]|nr:prepilin-type N-terminal cleavage/methylation domain-containing protein [Candidatus Riflebacteria bacterium]